MQSIVIARGKPGTSTAPFRDQLKLLGGVWNAARGIWRIPASESVETRQLQVALGLKMFEAGLQVSVETEQ